MLSQTCTICNRPRKSLAAPIGLSLQFHSNPHGAGQPDYAGMLLQSKGRAVSHWKCARSTRILAPGYGTRNAGALQPQPAEELRERDFGAHELGPDSSYAGVWLQDAEQGPSTKPTADGAPPQNESPVCFQNLLNCTLTVVVRTLLHQRHAHSLHERLPNVRTCFLAFLLPTAVASVRKGRDAGCGSKRQNMLED